MRTLGKDEALGRMAFKNFVPHLEKALTLLSGALGPCVGCVLTPRTSPFPELAAADATDGVEHREWLGLGLHEKAGVSGGPLQRLHLGKSPVGGNQSRKTLWKRSPLRARDTDAGRGAGTAREVFDGPQRWLRGTGRLSSPNPFAAGSPGA